jgi:HSP20 family molecular chaperone IbpA
MGLSLNILGINVGGLVDTCLQIVDNIVAPQSTYNNENTIKRQSGYQVSLPVVQPQLITTGGQYSQLQQQQPQQQSLEELPALIAKILQLVQIPQILQQLGPLLQQSSQLTQTQPSFSFGVNTTSLLDDNTNSKNRLTDTRKVTQSPDSIRKPTLVIPPSNARPKSSITKGIMFDITEENDFIQATVDMRGVERQKSKQEDIVVYVYNDYQLIISDSANTYNVEITLPSKVVPVPANKIYKNGILTLKFAKLQIQQQQLQLQQLLQQLQQSLLRQQQQAIEVQAVEITTADTNFPKLA